ncbi:MAG: lysoplasmalogenase [Firmicutes bacterium]|nr:lysoplasmalogenase [Bacillota bacterium]
MRKKLKLIGMGVLFFIAFVLACVRGHAWHWLVCLALGLSWVGDANMACVQPHGEGEIDPSFLKGMGAFALAQIAYIAAFATSLAGVPALHARVPGNAVGAELIGAMLPIYLLAGLLFWVLIVLKAEQPFSLKAAVLVYAMLLWAMAACACAAAFMGTKVVWPLILGGTLFIVSDGSIAAHEFQGRIADAKRYEIIVWGTYVPAQILLMLGASWLY